MPTLRNIFLGGGGTAEESRLLDGRFVALLNVAKPVVYIPNAMESRPYSECLEWFTDTMSALGVQNIQLWDDLRPQSDDPHSIAGVYMGGGNAAKLLREIRASGFDAFLERAIEGGVPVYGGSAGAIILGADIRTVPEARNLASADAQGLNQLSDVVVVCHYTDDQSKSTQELVATLGYPVVALPEKSGVYIQGERGTAYGTVPISLFVQKETRIIGPGERFDFPLGGRS